MKKILFYFFLDGLFCIWLQGLEVNNDIFRILIIGIGGRGARLLLQIGFFLAKKNRKKGKQIISKVLGIYLNYSNIQNVKLLK